MQCGIATHTFQGIFVNIFTSFVLHQSIGKPLDIKQLLTSQPDEHLFSQGIVLNNFPILSFIEKFLLIPDIQNNFEKTCRQISQIIMFTRTINKKQFKLHGLMYLSFKSVFKVFMAIFLPSPSPITF